MAALQRDQGQAELRKKIMSASEPPADANPEYVAALEKKARDPRKAAHSPRRAAPRPRRAAAAAASTFSSPRRERSLPSPQVAMLEEENHRLRQRDIMYRVQSISDVSNPSPDAAADADADAPGGGGGGAAGMREPTFELPVLLDSSNMATFETIQPFSMGHGSGHDGFGPTIERRESERVERVSRRRRRTIALMQKAVGAKAKRWGVLHVLSLASAKRAKYRVSPDAVDDADALSAKIQAAWRGKQTRDDVVFAMLRDDL